MNSNPIRWAVACCQTALVNVTHAKRAVMGMPTHGVRDGQPTKELGDFVILPPLGPDDKMPVVSHQGVGQDSQRHPFEDLGEDPFEGLEVGGLLNNRNRPLARLRT